jgi:hypothetical protein
MIANVIVGIIADVIVHIIVDVNCGCGVQSQFPNGRRGSSSVGMLTRTVRDLPNMTIKVPTSRARIQYLC